MGTEPMFDPGPPQAKRARAGTQRASAWGQCPEHLGPERTAIVRTASHMVWREHSYKTWGGVPMTCPGSGVPLCRAADRTGLVTCDHPTPLGAGIAPQPRPPGPLHAARVRSSA